MIANSTRALPPAVAARLVRICGMLGSSHAGEVANAGTAATRLIHEAGMTWQQLLEPIVTAPPRSPPGPKSSGPPPPSHWREAAAVCLAHADLLTPWEREFIANLLGFRQLSVKQVAVLNRVIVRVRAAGGGR